MKRLLPSRRFLKWTGLVVCVLIGSVWAINCRWNAWYADLAPRGFAWGAGVHAGALVVGVTTADKLDERGWSARQRTERAIWMPAWSYTGLPAALWLPLWIPFLGALAPAAWLWRLDRRPRPGHCSCGYDLAGLAPGAACPECGRAQKAEA